MTAAPISLLDPSTHIVEFDGALLRRGFWLYVMEVTTPTGEQLLYVGRTGDSSSLKAGAPYTRMAQHLSNGRTTSQVRKYLEKRGLCITDCRYRFIAHGPVLDESLTGRRDDHDPLRDVVAAMEKALADGLADAGYELLNVVPSKKPLDRELFEPIWAAFATELPPFSTTA